MEGKPLPRIDTRRNSGPPQKEKNIFRDAPIKSAVTGNFSENSTPRVAMTPVDSETPSLPVNGSDTGKSLARMFNAYTKGIINTTQSLSQHKTAKARLRRSRKDDEKWLKRYSDFAALEEMQNKSLVAWEKKSEKAEKGLEAIRKSHQHATAQIVSSLAQGVSRDVPSRFSELPCSKVSDNIEGGSFTTEEVNADMTRLRGDFKKLEADVQKIKFATGQSEEITEGKQRRLEKEFDDFANRLSKKINDLEDNLISSRTWLEKQVHDVSANSVSLSTVRAYEQNAASLKVATSKVEAFIEEQGKLGKPGELVESVIKQSTITALFNRIDGLQSKVDSLATADSLGERIRVLETNTAMLQTTKSYAEQDLKDQTAGLQAMKATSEKSKTQFVDFNETLARQSEDLRGLREAMFGDGGSSEAGVLDMIKDCQEDANKLRVAFKSHDDQMDDYENSMNGLTAKIHDLEDKLITLPSSVATISQLKEDLAQVTNEQEQKDDIVSNYCAKTDDDLIRQGDILKTLSEKLSVLESKGVSEEPLINNHTQILQQTTEKLQGLDQQLIKQESSISNLTGVINTLQLKMQELPSNATNAPHPSDAAIQHFHSHLTQHRNTITDLISKVDSLQSQAHLSRSATHSPHLTNGNIGTKEVSNQKIDALETKHQVIKQEVDGLQSSFQQFKASTTDTTSNHDVFINSLQQRFDNLTTDHMIGCIINQMRTIWPDHPANVQQQLTQVHQRQFQTDQLIPNLIAQVGGANDRLQKLDTTIESMRHHIMLRSADQSNLLEKVKEDLQQRIKVLTEDHEEKGYIRGNEARDHLNRIQGLQRSVQSLRTEHTNSIADLWRTLKDVQAAFQNLETVNAKEKDASTRSEIEQVKSALTSIRKNLDDVERFRKDKANRTEVEEVQSDIKTTQKRLDDVCENFIKEMATTHSTLLGIRKNIEVLNDCCGIEGVTSPATSRPGTAVTTTPVATRDLSPNQDSSPTQQLGVRSGSMSLGQASSPVRASTERTVQQDDDSDSEPIPRVKALKRNRRRRGGGSAENSPRGRKSSRLS